MDPRTAQLPANRNKPKPRFENLCPYGCTEAKGLNEHGYCRHLIGWTLSDGTEGSVIEMRERYGSANGDDVTSQVNGTNGTHERCGVARGQVREDDIVVEMATPTRRVYRKADKSDVLIGAPRRGQLEANQQVDALLGVLSEQAAQIKSMTDAQVARDAAWEKRFNDLLKQPPAATRPPTNPNPFPAPPG